MSLTDRVAEVELWIDNFAEAYVDGKKYYYKSEGGENIWYKQHKEDEFIITKEPKHFTIVHDEDEDKQQYEGRGWVG